MFNKNNKLKNVFLIGFLFSFHLALTAYVNSTFLSSFFGENKVGLIYTMASMSAIIALLLIPKVLNKFGSYKFLIYSSLLNALSLLLISIIKNPISIFLVFIFYFTLNNLIIFLLDELLQIFSDNRIIGKVRGLYLAIINGAWVIAQMFSGKILTNAPFQLLYFISFFIMLFLLLIIVFSLKNISDPKYDKIAITDSIFAFFKNKNLARSYKISFLLQFFYSWMVIYTPIYLSLHLGFTWKEISMIFTIMLLPFVLFQYPLGQYADKIGERKMLMVGFFIISLSTISLFFITEHSVYTWAFLLFGTRLGAATVEVMSDAYFFKHIKKENDEFIGVYRNTGPMAYILAPLIASGLFLILPDYNFIFLILGSITLYGVYLASTIRKNDI